MATYNNLTGASPQQHLAGQITISTPTAVGADEIDFVDDTITGAELGDIIIAGPTTAIADANAGYAGIYVSAANTVTSVWVSDGAVAASEDIPFNYVIIKRNANNP